MTARNEDFGNKRFDNFQGFGGTAN